MRAVTGRAAVVKAAFGADQTGPVAVTVTDGAGLVVATGTATLTAVGSGIYTYTLAGQARLDRLRVAFTGDADTITIGVRIVARRLATVEQVRQLITARESTLVGGVITDDQVLDAAIETAEDWIDEALHYPAVRQGWRARWHESGSQILHVRGVLIPGDLYEIVRDGQQVDVTDVQPVGSGWAYWDGTKVWSSGRYTAWGTEGLDDPPAQLVRACGILAAYLARASNVPERATVIRTEGSEIFLRRPGVDSPTGLPEVDSAIALLARPQVLGGW